jgi:hypothetical protein
LFLLTTEVEVWNLGMIWFNIMAYQRSSEQDICYICGDGVDNHMEHNVLFQPANEQFFSSLQISEQRFQP